MKFILRKSSVKPYPAGHEKEYSQKMAESFGFHPDFIIENGTAKIRIETLNDLLCFIQNCCIDKMAVIDLNDCSIEDYDDDRE